MQYPLHAPRNPTRTMKHLLDSLNQQQQRSDIQLIQVALNQMNLIHLIPKLITHVVLGDKIRKLR